MHCYDVDSKINMYRVPNADFVGYAVKTALREVTGAVRCWWTHLTTKHRVTSSVIYSAMETGRQQDCTKAFPYLISKLVVWNENRLMFYILKANPD